MDADRCLERLRALDVCDVSDALDALGLPPSVSGLRPLTVGRPIAGRAVTVRLAAGNAPEGSKRHLCTHAVELAGPGNVIVVEQTTGIDAAGWGGILSRAALARGVAGTIVEGPARDIEEAVVLGYPVFARSATARTARGRIHEVADQMPVSVGGIEVAPGDFMAIDKSGCAIVPAAAIEVVLDKAEAIDAKSRAMAKAVDRGEAVSTVMGADYESMLKGAAE